MEHQTPTLPEGWEYKKAHYRIRKGNRVWTLVNGVGTWITVTSGSELIDLGVDMFPAVIRKTRYTPNVTEIRRDARAHVARTVKKLKKSLGAE